MIFRRAALREFASTAAAVSAALVVILVTIILIRLLSQAAGGRVPADAVVALIGFSALNHLPVVLALSTFIAVLLSLTRSYRDSEMVVWFASGLPLTAWLNPVLRFAIPVALVVGGMSLFLSPWAQGQAAEYRKQLENRDEVSQVSPGMFRESASAQRVFFVESVSTDDGKVRNVFINQTQAGHQSVTVSAEGVIEQAPNGDRFAVLLNGRRYEGEPGTASFRVTRFDRYAIRIEPREVGEIELTPKITQTPDLLALPTPANLGELSWRIGLPVATVLLALLAIPLSFVNPRAGRTNNMLFAVLTFAAYVNFMGIAQAWISQGKMSPHIGLWVVHAFMFVLLLVLFGWRLAPNLRRSQ
ncbi:LPS export ABC transporter permease LptF [Uliginosibacterium sp. sgz301328]|uniref:LPS export ABC transporter permease LptF n=1 Tax=Uliginosibacterium sp. sgz301328 TaxID=3243764 RepID=UPI00359CF3C7